AWRPPLEVGRPVTKQGFVLEIDRVNVSRHKGHQHLKTTALVIKRKMQLATRAFGSTLNAQYAMRPIIHQGLYLPDQHRVAMSIFAIQAATHQVDPVIFFRLECSEV